MAPSEPIIVDDLSGLLAAADLPRFINDIPAIISIKNVESRLLFVSQKSIESLGLGQENLTKDFATAAGEVVGMSIIEFVQSEDCHVMTEKRMRVSEREVYLTGKEAHRTFHMVKIPVFRKGTDEIIAIVTMLSDVTSERSIEKKLVDALYDSLSPVEQDCLFYRIHGVPRKEIARLLGIVPETYDTYLKRIRKKLGGDIDLVRTALLNDARFTDKPLPPHKEDPDS